VAGEREGRLFLPRVQNLKKKESMQKEKGGVEVSNTLRERGATFGGGWLP